MAVDKDRLIDMMSFDTNNGDVVLTISDHLEWSDTVLHQQTLQAKFNTYIAFVESGEMFELYPQSKNRRVSIRLVYKHKPDQNGRLFIERARKVISSGIVCRIL